MHLAIVRRLDDGLATFDERLGTAALSLRLNLID